MTREYVASQLNGMWQAAVVAVLLYPPILAALIEAARPRFTSHERGQADPMPWAVGRVVAAQGSAKGPSETLGGGSAGRRLKARPEMDMSKEAVQRGLS